MRSHRFTREPRCLQSDCHQADTGCSLESLLSVQTLGSRINIEGSGAPGEIRTPDPLVRSQMLYPAELRARSVILSQNKRLPRVARFAEADPTAQSLHTDSKSQLTLCVIYVVGLYGFPQFSEYFIHER